MNLAYYPGCSIHATAKEYEISAKKVLEKLNVDLKEIKDWSCCGAFEAVSTNHLLSVLLPARNLSLELPADTEKDKIIMLCSACQQVHNIAKQAMMDNSELEKKASSVIGRKINLDIQILHLSLIHI